MSLASGCIRRRRTVSAVRSFSPFICGLAAALTLTLAGCGSNAHTLASADTSPSLSGTVSAARRPVSNAIVQFYTAGPSAAGIPLFKQPLRTDAAGRFTLPDAYTCPSPSTQVYVLASSGDHGNTASTLMAVLGPCDDLGSSSLNISELTTVASVAVLAPYMHSATSISAAPGEPFTSARDLAQTLQQVDADQTLPQAQLDSVQKLATLANIISACSITAGGSAGDGTPCGTLFAYTSSAQDTVPQDTLTALLAIANNPTRNVAPIFSLSAASPTFQPALATAPQDWSVPLGAAPAQPTFSPEPGTYTRPQTITLTTSTQSARIFYSIDGAWRLYTRPFVLPASKSIQTMALSTAASPSATAAYTVAAPHLFFLTQPASTSAGAILSPPPSVAVEDASGAVITSGSYSVTLALAPNTFGATLGGVTTTATANGIATFSGLTIPTPGTGYSLTASASGATFVTSNLFNNTGAITLIPFATTLTPGQSSSGFFTLSEPAQLGGATVTFTSSDPTITAISPATLTVPQGQSSGNFTYKNLTPGGVTLSAAAPGFTAGTTQIATTGVSVALTPRTVSLNPSQSQQFTAAVTGSSNTTVAWSISPAVGSISATGLYQAPASISTAQTLTVTATSLADSTKSATGSISLVPPTADVTITPGSVTLTPFQTQQFSAASPATFTISPAVGSISSSGLYIAPSTITSYQTITVTSTSTANTAMHATASINLAPPVIVTLTPGAASVIAGQTQQFSTSVTGTTNTALTWSISPALGSITQYGLYTAPTSFVAGQVVNVVATSVADPTKSAYAPVTLASAAPSPISSSAIGVTMTPATVSLYASQIQQYSVYVTGTRNTGITFSVSPAVGSVSQVGLYTAPASITSAQTVSVIATSNADGVSRAVSTVSLIPPVTFAASTTIPANFFGMTVFNAANIVPTVAFGTTRSWDSYPDLSWAASNPAPGVYNFAAVDSFIAVNQARGADMIYTLGRTPQWASYLPNQGGDYGPGQCAAPANFANYDAYITALATHVAGKIKYWELWNEPDDPNYYCGDVGSMVVMAQHAYRILKSIDPAAIILSPAVTGGPGPAWLASFLAQGGGNSIDIIGFHGYATANAEDFVGIVSGYRAVLSAAGVSSKPMWDTESSWAGAGNIGTPSSTAQVAFVAKDYLLHWSQGISRFVWYAYDDGSVWGGMLTPSNTPSAAATSYAQTYKWMVGASLSAPCSEDPLTQIWTCGLTRPNGYQAQAIWLTGSTRTVTVPVQFTDYRDLAGNVIPISNHTVTIGDQPLLLETSPLQ